MIMSQWEEKKILVTVKAYPNPSKSSVESSCTAGITEDGKWIRLFPLHWRRLKGRRRFKKYDWISLRVKKSRDSRPESYYPDADSITVVGSMSTGPKRDWVRRRAMLSPLQSKSIEELRGLQKLDRRSLGFIRPRRVKRLLLEPIDEEWSQEAGEAYRQGTLFDQRLTPLEKPPFKVSYEFECDDDDCVGHKLMVVDWEVLEALRKWPKKYGQNWERKFRDKFEAYVVEECDLHFFVGTMFRYPESWIIIGIFYPKIREKALSR